MITPVQTQDLVQRSGAVSEMRSHEQAKFLGDMAKAAAEMNRIDALKEQTVQKGEEPDPLNPDGSNKGKQDQQNKKKEEEEETQPETNTPAGKPLKLEGGDIIDLMA